MINQDCPPHRYVNGRCVNRAARTDGNPEGITCHARETKLTLSRVAELLKTLKVDEVLRAPSDDVESADVFAEKLAQQLGVPALVEPLARAVRRRDKDIVRTLMRGAITDRENKR